MAGGRRAMVFVVLVVTATVTAAGPAVAAPETDSTVTRISVAANGTATWEVQIRTRLPTEEDVADYERFQEDFRENTSLYLDPFRERMRGVVRQSANATGRPMGARGFEAETGIQAFPRRWGVVTYEFTWVHFAAHDGQSLAVGDVFDGQFYLTENDTFQVSGPNDYAIASVDPEPAEREPGVVRWFGKRSFDDDRPFVRFTAQPETAAGRPGSSTATPAGGDGSGQTVDGPSDGALRTTGQRDGSGETTSAGDPDTTGSIPAAIAVLVVGILAVGGYRYYRQSGGVDGGSGRSDGAGSVVATAAADRSADERSGDGVAAEADADGDASEGHNPAAGERESDTTGADSTDIDPSPVLTDADRVEEILAAHDGQLRQSDIVEALDWSKSKTSRVLSDMADEGRIEKLRIGRENIIRQGGSTDGADQGE